MLSTLQGQRRLDNIAFILTCGYKPDFSSGSLLNEF